MGDAVSGELNDFLARDLGTITPHHKGLRDLAPFVIGHTNDTNLENAGMLHNDLLDLLTRDILPTGYDDVFDAIL